MKRKIIQIYAALICVIAVITFLISISNLVSTFLDKMDPLSAGRNDISLTSFEYFKMDLLENTTKEQYYIPSDEEIMNMYNAAKDQHMKEMNHRILSDLIVYALLLVLSLAFFGSHWKILSKADEGA